MLQNQYQKIDYRKRRHLQPDEIEREKLKAQLYTFSSIKALAGVFSCTPENISMAFNGLNATLMNKIKIYVEKMMTRKAV